MQIPNDQQSTSIPYGCRFTIYGAMNTGVPQARDFLDSFVASLVENPKSHNFFSMLAMAAYEEPPANQNVGGFEVPVDDELLMQVAKPKCNLITHQPQGAFGELLT